MITFHLWTDSLRWVRVRAHAAAGRRIEDRIEQIERQIDALEEERDRLDRLAHSHSYRAWALRDAARRTA